ncbi:hypothetical protein GHO25_07355 [Pseudomonas sp. FSL R10-1350]|uniref:hypothetical protein n=1 Tax=Pseudomonas sp. FSL R10-1350 TaxID=2662197 RepID=UPI001295D140|nr:hypothetical protein [Pseudomonas sp. FSL R10-1350]MQU62952.1 hypothetical protein [Pseudomonas sp. FSL R10-1350]
MTNVSALEAYTGQIAEAAAMSGAASAKQHHYIHGDADSDVITESGPVPTIAKQARLSAEETAALEGKLADPFKGAGIVGWQRNRTLKAASTVAEVLSLRAVNIWEERFVALITDRPNIDNPETWDWAPAVQAASDYVRFTFNNYGPGSQCVIDFPGGRYKIKSKVVISAFAKIRSDGLVVFETEVAGDSAFHFTPSKGDYLESSVVIKKQQWFRGPFINGVSGGIVFRNNLAPGGCTGIELGPRSGELGVFLPFSRYSSIDFSVEGYGAAMKFNRFHNYIASFSRAHLENNTELVVFGEESGANVVDSGENIHFSDCVFAQCQTAFRWYCDGFDLNLTNCSIDYIGTVFRFNRLYRKITVSGGHMEGIGGARAHDGIGGILLEESTHPDDRGIKCHVCISGIPAYIEAGNMFRGSNRINLFLDFEYRKLGKANTPDKIFLCSPGISLRRQAIVNQHRATLPSWSTNQYKAPTFASEVDGTNVRTSPPSGFRVVDGSAAAVISPESSVLGGKSIKITGGASNNYFALDSTGKIPVRPGDMVLANLFAKCDASVSSADISLISQIRFYSEDDVQLSATSEDLNSLGTSDIIPGQWCCHAYSRQEIAPAGAAYYRTRSGISGRALNNVSTYLTGLYTTILK